MHSRLFLRGNEAAVELIPADEAMLRWPEIFGREAPVEVDLGCGDGKFLAAMAVQHPQRNFLGIERLAGRVRSVCRKGGQLANLRVLRGDLEETVQLLPAESVAAFHFLFPDPWPKRRHWRRRTFSAGFLEAIYRVLEPGGILRLATDQADYFGAMQRTVEEMETWFVHAGPCDFPPTTFEQKFQGRTIYRLLLGKWPRVSECAS